MTKIQEESSLKSFFWFLTVKLIQKMISDIIIVICYSFKILDIVKRPFWTLKCMFRYILCMIFENQTKKNPYAEFHYFLNKRSFAAQETKVTFRIKASETRVQKKMSDSMFLDQNKIFYQKKFQIRILLTLEVRARYNY